MQSIFIRHGQSTGNAGLPCNDLSQIELTKLGWEQAKSVAEAWNETPSLIITSPYKRTQQTACPTIDRFPGVPVEIWPIQEFTYLQPSRWNGTRSTERLPYIERYWQEADPAYCDGEGAESFRSLLGRADSALERLHEQPDDALVYVFSHGQFIQAVRALVTGVGLSERGKMRAFWRKGERDAVRNGEMVRFDRVIDNASAYNGFVHVVT
jgi:probable phosphoglycerate mutase